MEECFGLGVLGRLERAHAGVVELSHQLKACHGYGCQTVGGTVWSSGIAKALAICDGHVNGRRGGECHCQ